MTTKSQPQTSRENTKKQQPKQPISQGLDAQGEQVNLTTALQRAMAGSPSALRPADTLALQRSLGNRAVQRLLAEKAQRVKVKASSVSIIQRIGDDDTDVEMRDEKGVEITKRAREVPKEVYVLEMPQILVDAPPVFRVDKKDIQLNKGIATVNGKRILGIWVQEPGPDVRRGVWEEYKESRRLKDPIEKEGEPKLYQGMLGQGGVRYKEIVGQAFVGDPKSSDTTQGLGNCYFIASIASLADTPQGKALLKAQITPVDERAKEYTVTFAEWEHGAIKQTGEAIKVTAWFPVTGPKGEEGFAYALSGKKVADAITPGATVALWPVILEKAYAVHKDRRKALIDAAKGDYNLLPGGRAADVFEDTGLRSEILPIRGQPIAKVKEWLEQHRGAPIVAGTLNLAPATMYVSQGNFQEGVYKHDGPLIREEVEITFKPSSDIHEKTEINEQGQVLAPWGGAAKEIGNIDFQAGRVTLAKPALVKYIEMKVVEKRNTPIPNSIQLKHAYSVTGFNNEEITLYNPDGGDTVKLTYNDLVNGFMNLTAGIFPGNRTEVH